ncbi:MAG: TlpA disulfide reductase family protein [Actinomycetota bacterium]
MRNQRSSHHESRWFGRSRARAIAILLSLVVLAAACSGSDEVSEGITTNDGGVAVQPPDVLDGETEVIDGEDTAPSAGAVDTAVDDTAEDDGSSIGGLMPAPNPAFTWFDGNVSSVSELQGKPTVLNFWASTCAACIAEMPEFEEVFQAIGDEVAFVGMNTSDRREAADRLSAQTGVTYPLAADPAGEVFREFGLFVMPTTILLTAEGDIGYVWSGVLTEKELRILIDEHIAPGTYVEQ